MTSGLVDVIACVERHRGRVHIERAAVLIGREDCGLVERVLGGRALHEPPRDIDSVHVKGHPCLVHGIKSTVDRLFQARVTNDICQERWGETTMDTESARNPGP